MCYQGHQGWMDRNITRLQRHITTIRPQSLPTSTVSSSQENRGSTSSTKSVSAAIDVSTSSTKPSEDSNDTEANDLNDTMMLTTTLPTLCISSGSCVPRCGGGSDSSCWCDTRCTQAGDSSGWRRRSVLGHRLAGSMLSRMCLRHSQCLQPQLLLK